MRYLQAIYKKTRERSNSISPTFDGLIAVYRKVVGLFFATHPIIGNAFFKYLLFDESKVLESSAPFLGPFYFRASTSDLPVFREVALGLYTIPIEIVDALKQRKTPMVIVDCGANVGYATMRLVRVLIENNIPVKQVLCIEPSKENFKILTLNIDRLKADFNQLDAVLINGAVMDRNCTVSLKGDAYSWCSVLENTQGDTEGISVEDLVARSLSDTNSGQGSRRVLMKIDIEGGEIRLFKNPTKWLDEVAILFVERHDQLGYSFDESFKIIEQNGFTLWTKIGQLSNDLLFVHRSLLSSKQKL